MEKLSRAEQSSLATLEVRQYTKLQASLLRSQLNALELRGVPIKRNPEIRSASYFTDRRTLAYTGITDISVSILVSSETATSAITTMLIVPTLEGSGLLADDKAGTLWSDSFWICEEGRLKLIKPTRPIPIDGIDLTVDEREDPILDRFTGVNKRLYELTDDKNWTREALIKHGVKVPRGIFLTFQHPDVVGAVEEFLATRPERGEMVFKGNRGAHGHQVLMFDLSDNDVEDIRYVANDSVYGGEDVLIEERIVPPSNPTLNGRLEGQEADYNFRVLTTLDRVNPQAIDAEIRFQPKSHFGVNISMEAQAVRCDVLNNTRLIEDVNRMAEMATKAVCLEALSQGERVIGFAGVDLILGKDDQVYVMEVNAGKAGGFGTLCRLDKQPLDSIRDILISAAVPYLEETYRQRKGLEPDSLRRIPVNELDLWNLYTMFVRGRKYLQAENVMTQIANYKGLIANTDEATIASALAWLGNKRGRFEIVEQFINEKSRDLIPNPRNLRYIRLEAIRKYIKKRKQKLE